MYEISISVGGLMTVPEVHHFGPVLLRCKSSYLTMMENTPRELENLAGTRYFPLIATGKRRIGMLCIDILF